MAFTIPKDQEERDKRKSKLNGSKVYEAYGKSEDEYDYAMSVAQAMRDDLDEREQVSDMFNGMSYTQSYEYNQKKAINYAPPKSEDDRQVSLGVIHEKIISFAAIFMNYRYKRDIKCYREGNLIEGMGDIYELGISHSEKLEQKNKTLALMYWEAFTQGDAFVMEEWEVLMHKNPVAYIKKRGEKERTKVTDKNMDYTFEFLDNLEYEESDEGDHQTRQAMSRVLDGRKIIFGDLQQEDVQKQPHITLEESMSYTKAEKMLGTLKRWKYVPSNADEYRILEQNDEAWGSIYANRTSVGENECLVQYFFDKENNGYNIFCNGVMMLPRQTPYTFFYPRNNYPISQVGTERVRGSIYSRSIPAKTKFNADYVDFILKNLALKFEQGVTPAILAPNSKYTLTRDMFRAGAVTHGVGNDDYEFADPNNQGVTSSEFSFAQLMKEIIEQQTANPTTSGQLSQNATATEISLAEQNQQEKLGYILDGLVNAFTDMAYRRAETIEAKYTMQRSETWVDGESIPVYQDFSVNVAGVENIVHFDNRVGSEDFDVEAERARLFKKSHEMKEKNTPTEYFLVSPDNIRKRKHTIIIEVQPEKVKDTQLQMIQLWNEFESLLTFFGDSVDIQTLQDEYLQVSKRSEKIFKSGAENELEQAQQGVEQQRQQEQSPQAPQQPQQPQQPSGQPQVNTQRAQRA